MRSTALVLSCCALGVLIVFSREAAPARASAPVTLASGVTAERTTIPVTIQGQRTSCVLDTGSSAMLVSPALARAAGLSGEGGTFEVAPDGRTYMDRQTEIGRIGVGGHTLQNLPALISSNLAGDDALCGYDFFTRFPSLIDRYHHTVTLFPAPSKFSRMHCLQVDLTPHVPLATVEINGTWLDQIVLDSGMAGGGALWDGIRSRLREPLVANAGYTTNQAGIHDGFSCGASAMVRYASGAPESSMPICTEPRRPDGYNGIIETNLPSVHAMVVDYPHHRMCFDVADLSQTWSSAKSSPAADDAWARFNALRPPL